MKRIFIGLAVFLTLIFSFFGYLNFNYTTPIITYHSIDGSRVDKYAAVSPQVFLKQMEFIRDKNYRVTSLKDYCQLLEDGKAVPKKSVIITFDDGLKDNLIAIKILKDFGFSATFFLVPEYIGKEEYLSKSDILAALADSKIDIGSHTISHTYFPSLTREEQERQIKDSKKMLSDIFSRDIVAMAYPIGGFNAETLDLVKDAGYLCACATNRGFSKKLDRFALRRIKVTNRDLGQNFWAKLSGFYNAFRKPKRPF